MNIQGEMGLKDIEKATIDFAQNVSASFIRIWCSGISPKEWSFSTGAIVTNPKNIITQIIPDHLRSWNYAINAILNSTLRRAGSRHVWMIGPNINRGKMLNSRNHIREIINHRAEHRRLGT
jgi:hypothetical protein